MFQSTLKNTFKNLFRSATLWLMLIVLFIIVLQGELSGHYGGDADPNFVLNYKNYIQTIINSCCGTLLMYAMPVFTCITVVLVLNRDFGDHFFEIEKSAGVKPSIYLLGRLCALVMLNALVLFLMHLFAVYFYVYTRGGVYGMSTWNIISETIVRCLRIDIFVAMPAILFYIGLTYFIGSISKNGIPAAVISIAYIVFFYASYLMFRFRIAAEYFDYFSPIPRNLRHYFHYYDTEWFEGMISLYDLTVFKTMISICFLVGFGTLCSFGSYLCVKNRNL